MDHHPAWGRGKLDVTSSGSPAMAKLEQVTALMVAGSLAIASYWLFWSLAGGGGYDRRGLQKPPVVVEGSTRLVDPGFKARLEP